MNEENETINSVISIMNERNNDALYNSIKELQSVALLLVVVELNNNIISLRTRSIKRTL